MDIFSHNIFIQVPARVLGAMVMVFNATLKIFQLYHGGQSYCWRNRSTSRKPPICRKSLINYIT